MVIYPNDHSPAHVHVVGRGCMTVFELNCPEGPVKLRKNYGFSRPELNRIEGELQGHLPTLCRAWEDIHGEY